jgi:uncharacterized membrane protein YsdA (DUF1294 family)
MIQVQNMGAIPLTTDNIVAEATESMTRVQERERVMLVVVGGLFGALLTLAFARRP